MATKLVRLKPYNPKRGYKLRRFTYKGMRFDGSKGWYAVPESIAAELAEIHQEYYDEDSPMAFDVMTQDEAIALEEAETKKETERARASEPRAAAVSPNRARGRRAPRNGGDLTTADLPGASAASEDGDAEPEEKPRTTRRRRRS